MHQAVNLKHTAVYREVASITKPLDLRYARKYLDLYDFLVSAIEDDYDDDTQTLCEYINDITKLIGGSCMKKIAKLH